MLHLIQITLRTDLASAPWEILVNGASINLFDKLPTEDDVVEAKRRYDELTSAARGCA